MDLKNRPFIIGICGNSGSGKTALTKALVKTLGRENTTVLHCDDYHKWERGAPEWKIYTHLNPQANNLDLAASHLESLKKGNSISAFKYSHETGKFIGPFEIFPNKYIIFEGLHVLYTEDLRKNIDFKIFLYAQEDLNMHFKLHRDMEKRGYTKEQIMEAIRKREPDAKNYIYPQKEYADLLIEKYPLLKLREDKKDTAVKLAFIHRNNIDFGPLKKFLNDLFEDKICYEKGVIEVKAILSYEGLNRFRSLVRKNFDIKINKTILGLSQLFIAYNLNFYGKKIGRLPCPHG